MLYFFGGRLGLRMNLDGTVKRSNKMHLINAFGCVVIAAAMRHFICFDVIDVLSLNNVVSDEPKYLYKEHIIT